MIGSIFSTGRSIGDILKGGKTATGKSEPKKEKESSPKSKLQPGREMSGGSPQELYEQRLASGDPITAEEILAAKKYAASIGTTFNAESGYGATGSFPDSGGESAQPAQQPLNQTQTAKDTEKAASRVKRDTFVPASIRKIQAQGGPKTTKEANRVASHQSSTMGRDLNGGGSVGSGTDRTPHVSGTGKTAPHQSADEVTNSRGQISEKNLANRYSPMGKEDADKYAANLGKAWGNKLDQDDRETGNVSAQKQADNAGVSLEERNAAVAAGEARMQKYRAKHGKAPATAVTPQPAANPGETPEFFFAEGNADGTVSGYRGPDAKRADARLPDADAPKQVAGNTPAPKPENSPVDKDGKPKKFRANI